MSNPNADLGIEDSDYGEDGATLIITHKGYKDQANPSMGLATEPALPAGEVPEAPAYEVQERVKRPNQKLMATDFIKICEALAECGAKHTACATVGFNYDTVNTAIRAQETAGDLSWRQAWDLAVERHKEKIIAEFKSRAIDGWQEPVFNQGQLVGYVHKKSDRLLERLAEARAPELFGRNVHGDPPKNLAHQPLSGLPSIGDDVKLSLKARRAIREIIMADIAEQEELAAAGGDPLVIEAEARVID